MHQDGYLKVVVLLKLILRLLRQNYLEYLGQLSLTEEWEILLNVVLCVEHAIYLGLVIRYQVLDTPFNVRLMGFEGICFELC
jgi:hypothetical protein